MTVGTVANNTQTPPKPPEKKPFIDPIPKFRLFDPTPLDQNATNFLQQVGKDVEASQKLQANPSLIDTSKLSQSRDMAQIAHPKQSKLPTVTVPLVDQKPASSDTRFAIKDIVIEGTGRSQQILDAMRITKGQELRQIDLQIAVQRAFELGVFRDVNAELVAVDGGFKLVLKVKENPVIKSVQFDASQMKLAKPEELEVFFKTYFGQTANYNLLEIPLQQISELYAKKGFPLSGVSGIELQDDGTLKISIQEDEIEAIELLGAAETKDHVVLRELRQKLGQPLNANDLIVDLQRVFNYGFFDQMSIEAFPGSAPGKFRLGVVVNERMTGQANLGVGWTKGFGLTGYASVSKLNILGTGHSGSFQAARQPIGNTFDGAWSTPWLTDLIPRSAAAANAYRRIQGTYGFTPEQNILEERTGASAAFGAPIGDNPFTTPWSWMAGGGVMNVGAYDVENFNAKNKLFDKTKTISGNDRDLVAQLYGQVNYDTRDYWLDPKKGTLASVSVSPTLGDANNAKVSLSASQYIPLTKKLVLAVNAKGGAVLGDTPFYTNFYAVGNDIVRGNLDWGQIRGDHMGLARAELRFPTPLDIVDGVVFGDVGYFGDKSKGASVDNLHYGAGVGARFKTGMGILRLDVAPVDLKALATKGEVRFPGGISFGIGHAF